MAPLAGSSHSFQKLKLDTSTQSKPVKSTFASIPRHDSQHGPDAALLLAATGFNSVSQQSYSYEGTERHDHDGANGHFAHCGGDTATHGEDIEAQFRKRTTSISFDNAVTLDTGNRLSIEDPLPKFKSPDSRAVSDGEDSSDQDYIEIPAVDRKKRFQHRIGESRYPLLQTTVDDLANQLHDHDHVASLTSATTASPGLDEVRTPLDTPTDYLLSPIPATSPIEFPPFGSRRNGPQRTKSYRSEIDGEVGSLRKSSRRSSNRSGRSLSSMSPAASFLSRYKAFDGPLKPTEPDDEGQGFGYHNEYIIGKQIGFGGFSIVKEVTTIVNGRRVINAVKIVRKQLKDKSELENEQIQTQFDHEVEIWRFLRHPYILPLLSVYNTEFATFCITRLNKGGTLFDLVRDTRRRRKKGIDSHLAKRYTYQLASAIRYLHNDVQVVHRDIKLENCLIDMTVPNAEQDGGDVLLCDFGMADFFTSDQRDGPEPHSIGDNQNIGPADTSTSIQGSLQYAAPELFNAPGPLFSTAADIWSFGVVVFALLSAQLPFNEGLDAKTIWKIERGEWNAQVIRECDAAQAGDIEDALDLLKGCMNLGSEKRWSINDVLNCSWLQGCTQKFEDVSRSWLADP
ncbi:kinase-like domain-containing protein [Dendryphion nanum]|uniref:Kinase-like domain-containing protein n=1 Tax=Dendryphion nanum TaxID=256645 RepID=A0A9P9IXA3_9PLEO|nr:kinase-like domain-containing protein [Dendryphion nanum]